MLRNGVAGFSLVFLVLALFLELRLAFWVSLGIPISFFGALALMPGLAVSVNVLSLFGFVLVLGIVVDDAIIVGENIYRHQEEHGDGMRGSIEGAYEICLMPSMPSIASSMRTVTADSTSTGAAPRYGTSTLIRSKLHLREYFFVGARGGEQPAGHDEHHHQVGGDAVARDTTRSCRAHCCRARGTDRNWTRVDRKMSWSPAASSSQQRARVLTDVKARRFAPPPLRGADGP